MGKLELSRGPGQGQRQGYGLGRGPAGTRNEAKDVALKFLYSSRADLYFVEPHLTSSAERYFKEAVGKVSLEGAEVDGL
jgi:hypothetical protein